MDADDRKYLLKRVTSALVGVEDLQQTMKGLGAMRLAFMPFYMRETISTLRSIQMLLEDTDEPGS